VGEPIQNAYPGQGLESDCEWTFGLPGRIERPAWPLHVLGGLEVILAGQNARTPRPFADGSDTGPGRHEDACGASDFGDYGCYPDVHRRPHKCLNPGSRFLSSQRRTALGPPERLERLSHLLTDGLEATPPFL
jgi:hypothetical protein